MPTATCWFEMQTLRCLPLDGAAFAPFGTVLDTTGARADLINDGTTRRFSELATLDLGEQRLDPFVSIYEASARQLPLRLHKLERHTQASQAFIPLGPHRFIVVVAPGDREPVWAETAAFISFPGQGVCLRRGCWHHGLVALEDGNRFLVIDGGNYRTDTVEVAAPAALQLLAPASGLA